MLRSTVHYCLHFLKFTMFMLYLKRSCFKGSGMDGSESIQDVPSDEGIKYTYLEVCFYV